VHLCVLCGSQNKQRLFPYKILTDWFFITETESVYCEVRTEYLDIIQDKHVMLYVVILTVIKRIKFITCCVLFYHVRTKHLYRIPITNALRKITLSATINRKLTSYLASRNIRSVTKQPSEFTA